MNERIFRYYDKEEEFLNEFDGAALAASSILNGEWKSRYYTNDETRRSNKYFLSTGQLNHLVFDSAAVYHDNNGFSSVQIILKSSKHIITIRVRKVVNQLLAEKIVDKSNS